LLHRSPIEGVAHLFDWVALVETNHLNKTFIIKRFFKFLWNSFRRKE